VQRVEKTVFISYRRTNASWALAIFQNLTNHGYDVFYDYEGIASGDFEQVILGNIKARAHFLILLTPSALQRCGDPQDWLRREIETAIDTRRNIVPLMLDRFDFGAPKVAKQLTGKLAALKRYNALEVPPAYFLAAMDRLREKHLNVPLDAVLHPTSSAVLEAAKHQQAVALTAPPVRAEELSAQKWFERGVAATDLDEQLRSYAEAIRLNPDYQQAYYNRGLAHQQKGDLDGALRDYSKAIRLKPDDPDPYMNRGSVRQDKGDLDGALRDYDHAIRLKGDLPKAFTNRGSARQEKGDLEGAMLDYEQAIRLNPRFQQAYYNRGLARHEKGDFKGALRDYNMAIRLKRDDTDALIMRGLVRHDTGNIDDALRDYSQAIQLKGDLPKAYVNRGLARHESGDVNGALEDYKEAIRLKPDYPDTYYNRALVWKAKKRYSDAIADFKKYLALGGGIRDGDQAEVKRFIQELKSKAKRR
jgi:tetratricopeptide (TPR) repeat protein